jgi:MFS family permease
MKVFTKTILLLSLVSLLTDVSSEMLYPVMPMFLTSIGFSVFWIGILEGIAEATAGFSKGYFGNISDVWGKRLPFVRLGYFLSAVAKPALVLIPNPVWVLFVRMLDRLGKGIRTSARDALLSAESSQENKGKVFGLHRAADTFGAAVGPLFALVFLHFYPAEYTTLFFIAFVPAIVGVTFTFLLKEKVAVKDRMRQRPHFFEFLKYWQSSHTVYKRLVTGLIVFAVVNSSDIFLLLLAKHRGLSDQTVIAAYIFYNLVYALFSTPMGWLGDKFGLKSSYITGLFFFSIVYFAVTFARTEIHFFIIFLLYGIYAASTEGISKAWIAKIAKTDETATAIGFYNSFQSVAALTASVSAGLLWNIFSPELPFLLTACVSSVLIVYFIIFTKELPSSA